MDIFKMSLSVGIVGAAVHLQFDLGKFYSYTDNGHDTSMPCAMNQFDEDQKIHLITTQTNEGAILHSR